MTPEEPQVPQDEPPPLTLSFPEDGVRAVLATVHPRTTVAQIEALLEAQGVTVGSANTAGVCHSILSDTSSRALAYVGMTRAKDENHAYVYQRISGEADHEHSRIVGGADIHVLRRGNKWAAAHHFRGILANDDRPRTMHAEAERTERDLLPQPVSDLLATQEQRRSARRAVWREHSAAGRAAAAAYQRMATTAETVAERDRGRSRDVDGLEI